MATTITVLRETVEGSKFDPDYSMATHMPLVDETFKPFGLKGVGTPFGGEAVGAG